jgi:hypothetical protein
MNISGVIIESGKKTMVTNCLFKRVEIESQNNFFEINLDRGIKNSFHLQSFANHKERDENLFINFCYWDFFGKLKLNSLGYSGQMLKHF